MPAAHSLLESVLDEASGSPVPRGAPGLLGGSSQIEITEEPIRNSICRLQANNPASRPEPIDSVSPEEKTNRHTVGSWRKQSLTSRRRSHTHRIFFWLLPILIGIVPLVGWMRRGGGSMVNVAEAQP
jgi:hypothetical protein